METKTYTYGDSSWADLLTQYNGKAITYDGIGNMLTYNGSTYTWMGRELRKITNGSNTYSYKYNADGIRTSKTVNGTTTEFFLNGSQVLAQKTGDSVMRFFYDSTGKRVGFANGTMLFYYLYNVQGDVIAIVRAATGQIVAKYSYDAWGKCTVTNAAGYAVGDKNPFRYRGYYYDTETGLYYLNSRYYNPEFGRFISADGFVSTGQGITGSNMFAYCGNNPINRYDPSGNSFLGIAAGAVLLKYLAAIAASALLLIGIDSIVNNPPASPPITIPKFEFKSQNDEKTAEEEESNEVPISPQYKKQAFFPADPYSFKPKGLIMTEYPGSYNGRIIEWRDPLRNVKVFEWDEDYEFGPHYHAMQIEWDGKHSGPHYFPGTAVPEPWNSIYFGG